MNKDIQGETKKYTKHKIVKKKQKMKEKNDEERLETNLWTLHFCCSLLPFSIVLKQ